MDSNTRGEAARERTIQTQQLLLQSSQSPAVDAENEDNLIRIVIAVFGTLSSVGTLTAGAFAIWLAVRTYKRGLERTRQAAEGQSGETEANLSESNVQRLAAIRESEGR